MLTTSVVPARMRAIIQAVALGGFVACSTPPASTPTPEQTAMNPATSSGPAGMTAAASGSPASAAGKAGSMSAAAAGTSAQAGTSAVLAGAGGASAQAGAAAGASGAAAGAAGSSGMTAAAMGGAMATTAGAGGSAGAAGAAASGNLKENCTTGSTDACSSFTTSKGTNIALGPYGSIMETNVGKGFEVPLESGDSDDGSYCRSFTMLFADDPAETEALLDTKGINFALYTLYRPANLKEGEKYPILTWGNGTCAKTEGYSALLRYIASQGFFVVAANSRFVGSGAALKKGLDYMFAANADTASPFYQKLDTTKVGAMGHSQGSMGTGAAASDSRIKAIILFNGGQTSSKPFLAVSGDMDIVGLSTSGMKSAVQSSTKGAYIWFHMVPVSGNGSGHLTLMVQPERVVEWAAAWWKYLLNGDMDSKAFFAGSSCKLCNQKDSFEFGQKGLD